MKQSTRIFEAVVDQLLRSLMLTVVAVSVAVVVVLLLVMVIVEQRCCYLLFVSLWSVSCAFV